MVKFRFILIVIFGCLCLSACQWPRIYLNTTSGYVSYDRNARKLEIIWESTTRLSGDSARLIIPDVEEGVIAK